MASARGQAVERGPLGTSIHEFARRGLVDIAKDRRQAINRLVASYIKADLRDVTDRLALASKNADVAKINRKIQQARRQAGCLGNSASVNGELLFENDRVLFRKTHGRWGVRLRLGRPDRLCSERFQVAFVGALDRRWPQQNARQGGAGRFARIQGSALGYCSSVFRAQGVTQDNVFVLGDQLDKEAGYVALMRSRLKTMIFLSKEAAGDKLVNFAKSLKADNAKTLATTQLQEAQTLTLKKTL